MSKELKTVCHLGFLKMGPNCVMGCNLSHSSILGCCSGREVVSTIVPQLDKCLKFTAFRGVILYRVQSFLSLHPHPRTDVYFGHLPSCDTIEMSVVDVFR